MSEKPTFYTADDVAKMLGANQRTIRRWINNGELEASYLGGALGYRITAQSLASFLERRKIKNIRHQNEEEEQA